MRVARGVAVALALGAPLSLHATPGRAAPPTPPGPTAPATPSASPWVSLRAGDEARPVAVRIREVLARPEAAGRVLLVYLGATWCPPCNAIKRHRSDPRMVAAFEGALVVELDTDDWRHADLEALGYATGAVPVFFAVAADGHATGPRIDGGAWGEDVPENMAPPLARFVASLRR